MKLHIAETFHSLKGEGLYYGVPMFFIRFAGCNVGKQGAQNMLVRRSDNPELPMIKGTTCTAYDGRKFGCDTDYNKYEELDLDDDVAVETFFKQIWEHRVVLTGGEPMAQTAAFLRMLWLCKDHHKIPHVETSGTIDLDIAPEMAWISCAPKAGYHNHMLWRANEIKLLIDDKFDISTVPMVCFEHPLVFVCPINLGRDHNLFNLELCMTIVKQYPQWRVGVQLHKFLNIR